MTPRGTEDTPVDVAAIASRAEKVSRLLGIHAGGIDIESVGDDGSVQVAFTGMCTGCPYRAVTLATTVRPALVELAGVTSVDAVGVRVSEHAARRLAAIANPWWGQGDGHAQDED